MNIDDVPPYNVLQQIILTAVRINLFTHQFIVSATRRIISHKRTLRITPKVEW